jgi:RES domain-containing protein
MPTRSIDIDGARWNVYPSGYTTQYDADEFGLLFVKGAAADRVVRITRYSPQGVHSRESSLASLTDADVRTLFAQSQASFTSPEAGYAP